MTTTNGEAPAEAAAAIEAMAGMPPPRLKYDPDLLTPRDLIRARKELSGQNPQELMGDPLTQGPLVYWCIRSRDEPGFTYEQALDTPYVEFMAEEDAGDPLPSEPANEPGSGGGTASPSPPEESVPAPGAAPTSA